MNNQLVHEANDLLNRLWAAKRSTYNSTLLQAVYRPRMEQFTRLQKKALRRLQRRIG